MMKLVLTLIALLLAIVGAFFLFGIVVSLIKLLLVVGVLVLVVSVAVKMLKKPDEERGELHGADVELERADRLLEELKRKQLMK